VWVTAVAIAVVGGFGLGTAACSEVLQADGSDKLPLKDDRVVDPLDVLRPNDEFERIDSKLLHSENFRRWIKDSVVHDTLKGERMIEAYEIYMHQETKEVICVIKFGTSLNGYPGVIHGGITALMFDNSFGWLLVATNSPPSVTARLTVNYR
jgi:hypothetical protein